MRACHAGTPSSFRIDYKNLPFLLKKQSVEDDEPCIGGFWTLDQEN